MSANRVKIPNRDLAKLLGCALRTLERWQTVDGSPTSDDPDEWRAWIEANGLGRDTSKTKTQLQEQELVEKIALLRIKRAQAEGASIPLAEMGDFMAQFSARLDQLLTLKIETEAPPRVVGKDIVAIRAELRAVHDEIREIYNGNLSEWKPKRQ